MKRTILVLSLIFILGFFLRTFHLWNNVIFAYDQARDAQRIYDMVYGHHLKLVGPETDIPGIFHGPLFYYLLAPVYLLFKFNANYVVLFLIFLNLSGILIIYLTGKTLFDRKVGLLASFFWSISYEQANFSKFISNPSLMPLITTLFFFGLSLFFINKNKKGFIISALALGLAVHINFYLIYLIIFYPVLILIFKNKPDFKTFIWSLLLLLTILSTFLIAEIKFGFSGIRSLILYLNSQTSPISIINNLSNYIDKFTESLYYSFFSFNYFFAFLFFILIAILLWNNFKKEKPVKFLYLWILASLPLFAFKSGVDNTAWINSPIDGALFILISCWIIRSLNKRRVLVFFIIALITASNLFLYIKEDFINVKLFALQNLLYKDLIDTVDYTYKTSSHRTFSICAVTNPLFVNTLWSYIYGNYGIKKYIYLPFWSGPKQYLNKNLLPYDDKHVNIRYLIIEPPGGIPESAVKATIYLEDQISLLEDEKKFGNIIVQKRILIKDKKLLKDTQNLNSQDLADLKKITTIDNRYSCYHN